VRAIRHDLFSFKLELIYNVVDGFRYSTEWLLESTLLKIKSPAAYKHLRDSKLLPLPHPSTIQRLISGSPCEFGFSTVALESIRREFTGKTRRDRQGVLVFDEVKLRKTLDFNKGTLSLMGMSITENLLRNCQTDRNWRTMHSCMLIDHTMQIG